MILEYEKKQSIYAEKACEHVVNGVIRFDDLIITFYKPTNFSAQTKNFLLRDGHSDWKKKHEEFEMKMHEEWLEELGYDKTKYKVDYQTHEIVNLDEQREKELIKELNEFPNDTTKTESETI